ncbi:MAG: ATP synthase F0 subunit C [Oligoflexales bacterium]
MKHVLNGFLALAAFAGSSYAFASDGGSSYSSGLIALGAALAIGMGAMGAAGGQGRAASSALEGIARNPGARGDIFTPFMLGLVFMEFQALLSFAIAFMIQKNI